MFGRRRAVRSLHLRTDWRQADGPLAFELLEDRRLLAGDFAHNLDSAVDGAEGEQGCQAIAQIESVRVRTSTPKSIDIVFRGDMDIEPMISAGSIVDAVQLIELQNGPLTLSASQFTFDAAHRTLNLALPASPLSDYVALQLDGSAFVSCGGNVLEGGAGGLKFQIPVFAEADFVASQSGQVAVDNYSVPSLADWNNDTLLDLIVGEKTDASAGKIRVYLNEGTPQSPEFGSPFFVQSDGEDLTVAASGCLGIFPRVADWDGDGLIDLIVGLADGSVQVFLNTNSAEAPEFGAPQSVAVGDPGAKVPIQVGGRATPTSVDWNADGNLDLLVGALDGRVRLYLNVADTGVPDFRTEVFVQDSDTDLEDPQGRSSPAMLDLDGDGRTDLVLGNTAGQIAFYRNIGTNHAPAFDGAILVEAGGAAIDLDGVPRSRPLVADFDNDFKPDLLVGAQDGLVRLYHAQVWSTPIEQPGISGSAGDPYIFVLSTLSYSWHNAQLPLDATGDGQVDGTDIDQLFAELNAHEYHDPYGTFRSYPLLPFYCDVNDDTFFTPRDVLYVIRAVKQSGQGEAEAEGESDVALMAPAHASVGGKQAHDGPGLEATIVTAAVNWRVDYVLTGQATERSDRTRIAATSLDRHAFESLEDAINEIATARRSE